MTRVAPDNKTERQLYLYLKGLLQLLQLVGGEDCPVSPLLLLLLPEHAPHTGAQPGLLQFSWKRESEV